MAVSRWGVVTAVGPVRVKLDGETLAVPVTLPGVVDQSALSVDEMVLCDVSQSRPIIIGRSGGGVPSFADWSALGSRMGDAESAIIDLETRTQGVIPSSVVVGSGSASVAADGTITFTDVSSVSLNDVFDGLFSDTYECDLYISSTSGSLAPEFRLRDSGVDDSSSVYKSQILLGSGGSTVAARYTSETEYSLSTGPRQKHFGRIRLAAPAKTIHTAFHSSISSDNDAGGSSGYMDRGGFHYSTTAFDGFTLLASTGTMTGTLKVVRT